MPYRVQIRGRRSRTGRSRSGIFTPLLAAAACGGLDTITLLLEHGAKVNAQDVRGMTPLMLSLATDHADARVVKLLLAKGADPKIKDGNGETAADWARKFQDGPVMAALGIARQETAAVVNEHAPNASLDKSITLLQRVNANFMKTEGASRVMGRI